MKRHGTKFLNALALLLILVTAHAGKVLHTHPDAYYRALEQTRSDQTRTTIVDDCRSAIFSSSPASTRNPSCLSPA